MAQLNIGDAAPDFELPLTLETTWKLSDYIGKKNILLLFFPFAFSPPCHEELCSVRDGFSEWQALDAEIVGISVDHPFVLEKWRHLGRSPGDARLRSHPGKTRGAEVKGSRQQNR